MVWESWLVSLQYQDVRTWVLYSIQIYTWTNPRYSFCLPTTFNLCRLSHPSLCVGMEFPSLARLPPQRPLWRQSSPVRNQGRIPSAKKTKMSRLRYHWLELDFLAIVELLFVETLHLLKLETEADEVVVAPRGHVRIPEGGVKMNWIMTDP